MNLKKVLYENYGVLINDAEDMFWRHIITNNTQKKLSEALEEFSETTELQYFNHRHFNDIAKKLVKEEVSRDQKSGYKPKDTQNITPNDILYYEYDIDESDEDYQDDNSNMKHVFSVNLLNKKISGNK